MTRQVLQNGPAQVGAKLEFDAAYWNSLAEFRAQSTKSVDLAGFEGKVIEQVQRLHPGRILDIGCGDASIATYLESFGAFGYVGVDPSFAGLRAARRTIGRPCNLVAGDGLRLPIQSQTVDLVLMVGALHHGGWGLIEESGRVLRPGGSILIVDHAVRDSLVAGGVYRIAHLVPPRIRRLPTLDTYFLGGGVPETLEYTKKELSERLTECGLGRQDWITSTASLSFALQCCMLLLCGLAPSFRKKMPSLRRALRTIDRLLLSDRNNSGIDFLVTACRSR